jgi:hypothetical protein
MSWVGGRGVAKNIREKIVKDHIYFLRKQCCGSGSVYFGPPGSGSVSQKYRTRILLPTIKNKIKTLIPTVL